jgi:teichoic acid transport system permease protein
MFKNIIQLFKEQYEHKDLIFRMAAFDSKSNYQSHYLGTLWQFIHPAIQIAIYWVVFGLGIRNGRPVDGVPFFIWLLAGLVPWFFIAPSIIQGANSIYQRLGLVSKMNFPVSILPSIKIVEASYQFFALVFILLIVVFGYGITPTLYTLQLIYYVFCMFFFLFSLSVLTSTISTLVRDFQTLLQSVMRVLLYLSPIIWVPSGAIAQIMKLNPLYYIIEGFRDSLLSRQWFYDDPTYFLYFWVLNLTILYFGANIHMKFRKNFMDYL